ncbi:hypothetical protein WSK_0120 [Novosphingobium sp. Rr 2-17]|uniref:hypothetical protein n=1 Tax=Novosphingobium sp. Rr 2-17 TaxID=555793 RepID=UPI0002697ADF|nr:hypothetical protein [Novosphingobium sp. Rr 2-17]EIZ81175.1 hypothetical protein WSK_0120 [Novosphingobium sp. Rr 2-17]
MTDDVSAWRQSGTLYVWRYAAPGRSRRGWHFSADPSGCASVVDLIDRMTTAAVACHRTLSLGHVSADIWGVPNFGPPQADRFEKVRIAYLPAASDLSLVDNDGSLDLTIGGTRAGDLKAAFVDVGIGDGDFGIGTSERKNAETWMFWWMPRINCHDGKRL